MIGRRIVVLTTLGIQIGCQHINSAQPNRIFEYKKLVTHWVRSTEPEEYMLQPLLHRMPPVLFGDLVIAGNGLDSLTAYDKNSGQKVWRLEISGGVEGGAALEDTILYFGGNDGNFYAVNATNGKILWKSPVEAEVLAAPSIAGERLYFMTGNNVVHALKKANGSKVWTYHRQQPSYFSVRAAATPLVVGNNLYVGTADGFLVNLNATTGGLIWERQLNSGKKFRDVDSTPIRDDDRLYVSSFDGALYCLELQSGKIEWRYDEGGYLPPLIKNKFIYYPTTTKKVVALNKITGKEIWKLENLNGIPTEVTALGEHLVFGESSGNLKLVTANEGKVISSFQPGRGLMASATFDLKSNLLFLMSNGGNLFALRLEDI